MQSIIKKTTKLWMLFYHLSSDIDVGDGFPLAVTHIDVSILSDFMLYFMDRPFKFRWALKRYKDKMTEDSMVQEVFEQLKKAEKQTHTN